MFCYDPECGENDDVDNRRGNETTVSHESSWRSRWNDTRIAFAICSKWLHPHLTSFSILAGFSRASHPESMKARSGRKYSGTSGKCALGAITGFEKVVVTRFFFYKYAYLAGIHFFATRRSSSVTFLALFT